MQPQVVSQPDRSTLAVTWSDGHPSRYDAAYLRRICPCAECDDERRRHPAMRPLTVSAPPLELVRVGCVGRYAFNLTFSDGHGTGIYAFDFLRTQCPCAACQPVAAGGSDPEGV